VNVEPFLFGGLRFGEAAALRRGRCDLLRSRLLVAESIAEVNGEVIVGPTKTHQQGAVVLPRFVRDHLAAHLAARPGEPDAFVFPAPGGGPLRYSNFYRRVWRPALERAGLPGSRIHSLRHTCPSLLVAQGATVKALQAQLRHRDPALTLRVYSHLYSDEHDELARRLDAAYGGSDVYPVCTPGTVTPLPADRQAL
jgi:integrase